ncbi:hypothetical protein ACFW2T_14050 [Streptomyces sp. NPDC058892]|uniref:hypothetical protein n=1 Tax=unclassified Streptomyces TaxID=2593676 RepID=UPI0036D10F31
MGVRDFLFSNPDQHGASPKSVMGKPSRSARNADRAGAQWEDADRARERTRSTSSRGFFAQRGR